MGTQLRCVRRHREVGFGVLRDGKLTNTFFTAADALAFTPDATQLVVTINSQLVWYDLQTGLKWSFTADDTLHSPRIDSDGKKVVVCSEIGTIYVLGSDGVVLQSRDVGSLASAVWLPGRGGLIATTWEGSLIRLGGDDLSSESRLNVSPADGVDAAQSIVASDPTETVKIGGWTNSEATPFPLIPNLLSDTKAKIDIESSDHPEVLQNPAAMLVDGTTDPPSKPWLDWTRINYIDSGWTAGTSIVFDTWRTQLHLTGITFVEDPAHPESWLRDMVLQYWDPEAEKWVTGPTLLSDTATHTHILPQPLDASRYRLISSGGGQWPVGNVRLAEVVFHGSQLGRVRIPTLSQNGRKQCSSTRKNRTSVISRGRERRGSSITPTPIPGVNALKSKRGRQSCTWLRS